VNVLIVYSDLNAMSFLVFIILSGVGFVGLRFVVEGKRNLIMSKLAN
jgi:hypothetical protein